VSQAAIELQSVSKRFGPTAALQDVSLQIAAGEVRGIAGANGAGKSTLIKILAGVHAEFEGHVKLGERRQRFASPAEALAAGISTIHQELSLIGSMSVSDNLLLSTPAPGHQRVDRAASDRRAKKWLARQQLDVEPSTLVETLPLAVRQRIEIARALERDAQVIILDEPTSALRDSEADALLTQIRALADAGKAVIYISHRLGELLRVADQITVLRDGEHVWTRPTAELDEASLIRGMLGREVTTAPTAPGATTSTPRLELRALRLPGIEASAVDLTLGAGEIVGVAGLDGSGAHALLWTLFGAHGPILASSAELDGHRYRADSPRHALRQGVILLTGDRERGIALDRTVSETISLSTLEAISAAGLIDRQAERQRAEHWTEQLDIDAPALTAPLRQLSGGNQQKVALARTLLTEPRLLLLDEPTRGVDLAAKASMHAQIRQVRDRGASVLLFASELDELLALSDRIAVLVSGRAVRVFDSGAPREAIVTASLGGR